MEKELIPPAYVAHGGLHDNPIGRIGPPGY